MEKGPEILACDPGVIKIHIRIMQMENQLWIRACLMNVIKAFEYKTTFISGLNFLDIILETLQGGALEP